MSFPNPLPRKAFHINSFSLLTETRRGGGQTLPGKICSALASTSSRSRRRVHHRRRRSISGRASVQLHRVELGFQGHQTVSCCLSVAEVSFAPLSLAARYDSSPLGEKRHCCSSEGGSQYPRGEASSFRHARTRSTRGSAFSLLKPLHHRRTTVSCLSEFE